MTESELRVGATYKIKGGNTFKLFRGYDADKECFIRQDGQLHFGREFIEFKNGSRVLHMEEG